MRLVKALAVLSLLMVTPINLHGAPLARFHFVQCPGSPETHLNGVNDNNEAVGYCLGLDGIFHGVKAAGGTLTYVDAPGATNGTFPEDVNSNGAVVGFYLDDAFNHHAFTFANGQFTELVPPGSVLAIAFGVDERGRVSGEAEDEQGVFSGWVYDGITYRTVALGFGITAVRDITERNLATVSWQDQPPFYRSSLYRGGKLTDINVPGAISTVAHGINAAGDVAFSWTDDAGSDHGAAMVSGKITKFDAPGCDMTDATGINDNHVIVGTCTASEAIKGFYVTY